MASRSLRGSHDCTVRLWNTALGNSRIAALTHEETVLSITYSPDGKTLASATETKGSIYIWDPHTGDKLKYFKVYEDMGFASILSISYSGDGKRLACHTSRERIHIWELERGGVRLRDPKRLLAPDNSNQVPVRKKPTLKEVRVIRLQCTTVTAPQH